LKLRKKIAREEIEMSGAFASGKTVGSIQLDFSIGSSFFSHRFYVVNDPNMPQAILGIDFYRKFKAKLYFDEARDIFRVNGKRLPLLPVDVSLPVVCSIQSVLEKEMDAADLINILTPEEEDVREVPLDSSSLLPDQDQAINRIISSFGDIIVDKLTAAGQVVNSEGMKIPTTTSKPHYCPPRRLNPNYRSALEKIVNNMIDQGILVPYNGGWGSPMFLVPKANGDWRGVIDYRPLNAVTEDDRFPLPRIDEILASFHGAKFFTVFDGAEGYHQFKLDPESIGKSAISTPFGNFAPTVVTFGLKNAPAFFQRQMSSFLKEHAAYCLVYLDDIIIFSASFEEHLVHVQEVLKTLRKHKFCIKKSKCRWAQSEVSFLGHKVTRNGIVPNPVNVEKIVNAPVPKDISEVRSFLGLSGYYRKFIRNYADIARPLCDLLKKGVPWAFQKPQLDAFHKLKKLITSPPVLAHPDLSKPFILETDASGVGIGGVLSQIGEDGKEHPIAFYSRSLNPAQRNYGTVDREGLAIYACVIHWEPYLEGNETLVRTDQQSLQWIFKKGDALLHSGRTARMLDRIQHLQLTVTYKPGASNQVADWCSRPPCIKVNFLKKVVPNEDVLFSVRGETRPIFEWQQRCEETKALYEAVANKTELPEKFIQSKRFLRHLQLLGRVLVYNPNHLEGSVRPRIVLPTELRRNILYDFHDSNQNGTHQGRDRTKKTIYARFWWPSLDKDVKRYVHECPVCNEEKSKRERAGMLQPFVPPDGPFERVGIDWIGPLPTSINGNQYCLVIMDHYSRFPWAFPVKNKDAATLAKIIMNELEPLIGPPKQLLSDQGSELIGQVARELYLMMHTEKLTTTAYHPQTNGMVERFNGTLKEALNSCMYKKKDQWETYIPHVLSVYRTSVHSVTGYSPHELLFGVAPNKSYDMGWVRQDEDGDDIVISQGELHDYYRKRRLEASKAVRLATEEAFEVNKARYDKKRVVREFKVGQKVWRRIPKLFDGTFNDGRSGPYQVLGNGKSPNTYAIMDGDGKKSTVNVSQLELYLPPRVAPPTLSIVTEAERDILNISLPDHKAPEPAPVQLKKRKKAVSFSDEDETRIIPKAQVPIATHVPNPAPQVVAPTPILSPPSSPPPQIRMVGGEYVRRSVADANPVLLGPPNLPKKYEVFKFPIVSQVDDENINSEVNRWEGTDVHQQVDLIAKYLQHVKSLPQIDQSTVLWLYDRFKAWNQLNAANQTVLCNVNNLLKRVNRGETLVVQSLLIDMIYAPLKWIFKSNSWKRSV